MDPQLSDGCIVTEPHAATIVAKTTGTAPAAFAEHLGESAKTIHKPGTRRK